MNFILLQAAGAAPQQPVWSMPLMMVGVIVIMYFFMIRPQMQKQKKDRLFRESLKKDDKIITIGGIIGKIVSLDEKTVLVQVDDSVKLRFERAAIRELAVADSDKKS